MVQKNHQNLKKSHCALKNYENVGKSHWERKNTDRRFLPNGAEKFPKRQKITLCPEKLRKRRKITLGTVKYPSPGFAGGGAEKSQGGQKFVNVFLLCPARFSISHPGGAEK